MAKRGDQARESVKNTIIAAFSGSNDYVGFVDKKIYVTAQDGIGGEKIQFAISMTMPKTPLSADAAVSAEATPVATSPSGPVVLAEEDEKAVDELMKKLGIED